MLLELEKLAKKLSFNFAIRPVAPISSGKAIFLSGYGVELMIKSTEYKVTDDSSVGEKSEEIEIEDSSASQEDSLFKGAKMEKLSEDSLKDFGSKVASVILDSSNKYGTMKKVAMNLPLFASSIAAQKAKDEIKNNLGGGRLEGQNIISINGFQVNTENFNSFR